MITQYGLKFCQLWKRRDALEKPCYSSVKITQIQWSKLSLQMISAGVPRVGAQYPVIIVLSVVMYALSCAIHMIEITSSTCAKRNVRSPCPVTTYANECAMNAPKNAHLA
jgi:hypothetical protein